MAKTISVTRISEITRTVQSRLRYRLSTCAADCSITVDVEIRKGAGQFIRLEVKTPAGVGAERLDETAAKNLVVDVDAQLMRSLAVLPHDFHGAVSIPISISNSQGQIGSVLMRETHNIR